MMGWLRDLKKWHAVGWALVTAGVLWAGAALAQGGIDAVSFGYSLTTRVPALEVKVELIQSKQLSDQKTNAQQLDLIVSILNEMNKRSELQQKLDKIDKGGK